MFKQFVKGIIWTNDITLQFSTYNQSCAINNIKLKPSTDLIVEPNDEILQTLLIYWASIATLKILLG